MLGGFWLILFVFCFLGKSYFIRIQCSFWVVMWLFFKCSAKKFAKSSEILFKTMYVIFKCQFNFDIGRWLNINNNNNNNNMKNFSWDCGFCCRSAIEYHNQREHYIFCEDFLKWYIINRTRIEESISENRIKTTKYKLRPKHINISFPK